VDIKSCQFGEIDALLIPFANIHNVFVDTYNSMVCSKERMKELGAAHTFNVVLSDMAERHAACGWKDESSDFVGRVVAKDATILHSAAAHGQIRDAKGNPLSEEALKACEAKMPGLKAQLDVLKACGKQFDFYFSKKENLPDFKYGPFSLALRHVGGLQILQVLRLPENIKGDAKPPMFPDLVRWKYTDGGYPRTPNPELEIAVEKFNNTAFEIRGILNRDVSIKDVVKEAVSKLKLAHIDPPKLIITVNGMTLDFAFLESLSKLATGEALDKGEAVAQKGVSLKDLKMPKIPTLDDIMQLGDGFLQKLTSGELDVGFELKPPLEDIMDEDTSSYLKDLPKHVREVIKEIAGDHASSLKSQCKEAFELLKTLLDPDGKDVPEGELSFEQQQGLNLPPWFSDKAVGKGSAVKYPLNLPKIFEKVPALAQEMQSKLQEIVSNPMDAVKPMSQGGKLPDKGIFAAKHLPGNIIEYGSSLPKLPSLAKAVLAAIMAVLRETLEGFYEGAKAAVKAIDAAQVEHAAKNAAKDAADDAQEQVAQGIHEEVTERKEEMIHGTRIAELADDAQEQVTAGIHEEVTERKEETIDGTRIAELERQLADKKRIAELQRQLDDKKRIAELEHQLAALGSYQSLPGQVVLLDETAPPEEEGP